jgi:hypothetical protein
MSESDRGKKARPHRDPRPRTRPEQPSDDRPPQDGTIESAPLAQLAVLFDDDVQQQVERKCVHYRPFLRSCLTPVSVGDLLIVEQELCDYAVGEVAQIENVMARERREYSTRDLSRITETTESSIEREVEESQSTKVDERFSLSVQSQEAQRQQTAISGNVSASYRAPAFSATIGANASYSNAKDSSYTTSQEYARTVTEEATKRIRETVSESRTVTVVTESVKTSLHGFDNRDGTTHIQGIYRWVDKRYKAQLYDYGKRLFLQFYVPEPAFFLRDVDTLIERQELQHVDAPVHPRDRRPKAIKSHLDITEDDYPILAAEYDVVDIATPPPLQLVRGKGIAHPDADQGMDHGSTQDQDEPMLAKKIDTVIVEPGYHLTAFNVNIPLVEVSRPGKNGPNPDFKYGYYTTIGFSDTSNDVNTLLVNVLETTLYYVTNNDSADNDKDIVVSTDRFDVWHEVSDQIEGEVPITVGAEFEGKFYFNILYKMERNSETLEQWQIDTYAKILQGYRDKLQEHEQTLQEAEFARDTKVGQLKAQPREEAFRQIEAHELRKHCIDILTRHTAFAELPRKLNELPTGQMEINLAGLFGVPEWQANHVNGVTTAAFEEWFEWELLSYKLYPYFWTDKERWAELYRASPSGDALFDDFLKAGYAKVVVPLRPSYERSLLYYLRTNLIWAGGEVPAFDDDGHLSLLEELHDSVQLEKGDGKPVGPSWDVTLPTSLIYLQAEPELPQFDCDATAASGTDTTDLPSGEVIAAQEAELAALTSPR